MSRNTDPGAALLLVVLVLVVVFLGLREVMCWYWKINQHLALLTEIRDPLRSKVARDVAVPPMPGEQQSPASQLPTMRLSCPACQGAILAKDSYCGNCGSKLH